MHLRREFGLEIKHMDSLDAKTFAFKRRSIVGEMVGSQIADLEFDDNDSNAKSNESTG